MRYSLLSPHKRAKIYIYVRRLRKRCERLDPLVHSAVRMSKRALLQAHFFFSNTLLLPTLFKVRYTVFLIPLFPVPSFPKVDRCGSISEVRNDRYLSVKHTVRHLGTLSLISAVGCLVIYPVLFIGALIING